MCRGRNVDLLPYVVATVRHMMTSEEACLDMCDYGVVPELTWMLGPDCRSPVLVWEALQVLNVMAEYSGLQRMIVEKRFLPLVLPLHSSAHEAIRQTSVQVTAKLARNSQNRARIIYNGGHEALVYHANFSPDTRTREVYLFTTQCVRCVDLCTAVIQVAQPAADELLNTLEYRTRKTVGRFTSKIRELAEEREE